MAQTSGRSGIAIVVPTTAGPIQIKGLRWSQRIPGSRVVLSNETGDQCERWTKDYNNLLKPGDPMRTLLGLPEQGGFRLVVTAEIDQGKSWIMPVAAAHFANGRGEPPAAAIAPARLMLFTTGALDFALAETAAAARVVEQDYELNAKIMNTRDLFAEAAHAGTPVLAILPAGPDAERAKNALQKVLASQPHLVAIAGSLAELTAPLESFLRHGDFKTFAEGSRAVATIEPEVKTEPPRRAEPKAEASGQQGAAPDAARPEAPAEAARARPLAGDAPPRAEAATASAAFRPVVPPQSAGGGLSGRNIGLIAAAAIVAVGGGALAVMKPWAPKETPSAQNTAPTPVAVIPAPGPAPAPQPAAPQQAAQPTPASVPAGAVAVRLTVLTAPPGSTCQAQVFAMQPRFVETSVEAAGDAASIEASAAGLCGLAVQGVAPVRARFQNAVGVMASLSGATRIVFQPGAEPRPPMIALEGAGVAQMQIVLK
jgi:hypothetical protein